jgi:hypothetical protein
MYCIPPSWLGKPTIGDIKFKLIPFSSCCIKACYLRDGGGEPKRLMWEAGETFDPPIAAE